MNINKFDVKHQTSIHSWDEALPLGNGKLGCLVYGDGPLRLAVDRVDLWDLRPNPTTLEKGFCYKNLVKLSTSEKEWDWAERDRLFENIFTQYAYPSKITAGRIELDFGCKTENISGRVDIKRAVADVVIDGGKGRLQAFMSATKFVGVAKVTGEYSLRIHIPDYISGDEGGNCQNNSGIGSKDEDGCLRYPRAEIVKDGGFTYYDQTTHTSFRYGIVVYEKVCGGYKELYFTIATNKCGEDYIELAKKELLAAAEYGYEKLFSEHAAWWKKYWAKSSVEIKDELLEKVYYRAYYLFASCSRKGGYPMPLQGVWTADNDSLPPWKGDYHHDTNTELSYQSYLKANRLEEGRVFIDYLWSLKRTFTKFAKEFFGVKGILLPSCSTLDGKAMGGWAQYSLSPTMSIWAAQSFDEYYLYTGDEKFLKTRAYPFLKGVGEGIFGLLEKRDGKWYLPISSSPEIFDAEPKSYLKPNSNFDLALMRYLYKTLAGYAKTLRLADERAKYEKILSELEELHLDKDGDLMLDGTQKLRESHRHFSHLMALYPLHLINYDTEEGKRVYQASLRNIEFLGMGMWVGFSYAMCAQIYATAYMGNSAYEKLRQFCNGFVAENGFHLNGDFKNYGYTTFHYRPFTLESLFGYCDALQEMLMQEHQGYIHLFPAIPKDWSGRELSFRDLRSYGGVLVSAKSKNGIVHAFSVTAKTKREITIKNTFGREDLSFSNGQTVRCKKGELFTLTIEGKVSLLTK